MHLAPHRSARRWAVVPLLLVLAFALSGCVRVRAAMAVDANDLVSGTLEIATVQVKPEEVGPVLTIPSELSGQVTMEPYNSEGYVGQTVRFNQLSFDQLRTLTESISQLNSRYKLNFRRSGDIVSLAGVADLTQLRPDGVDVQLKIAFPGPIGRTNGILEMDNNISWKLNPGRITDITATSQYNSASGMSWTRWVLLVGAGAVGTALIVLALALYTHRRTRRKEQMSEYA